MTDLVYTPPQVSIQEQSAPVPNLGTVSVLPPSRVALVGPGVGYQTFTEAIVLTGTTPKALTQKGVDTTKITVSSLAGAVYTETTDWVSVETGAVAEEAVTTIARTGGGAITSGQTVYVTYQYTDTAYYLPYQSSDFDQIQSRFGKALDPDTGAVTSPLSLAAKFVLEAGAVDVVIVPTKGSTPTSVTAAQINTAYASLASRRDIGTVVPLPVGLSGTDGSPATSTTLATDLELHCVNLSAQGYFRIGILGYDTTATRSPSVIAAAVKNSRVVVCDPQVMSFYNPYTRTTVEIGGMYLAAHVAGMAAALPPAEPLTRKTVRSFAGIPARIKTAMTADAMNSASGSGVLVVDQETDGRLFVRHSVTTDMTSVLTREVSIVRAKDAHIRLIQNNIERSGLLGRPGDQDTPSDIQGLINGSLTQCQALGLIDSWSNLTVRRSESDPTVLEVRYSYVPIFPTNQISVIFSINTVTGNILQEAA